MDRYTKATDFVRIGKGDEIYEFHTVTDFGGHFVDHYQEGKFDRRRVTREQGNKIYTELIQDGFKPLGRFEMDILGHKVRKGAGI